MPKTEKKLGATFDTGIGFGFSEDKRVMELISPFIKEKKSK